MKQRSRASLVGLLCAAVFAAAVISVGQAQSPASSSSQKIDLSKPTRYYADTTVPNISGVWRSFRDNYRPVMVSDFQRASGAVPAGSNDGGGLLPGVLPRDFWIVDGKPLPGRHPGGPWAGIPFTPKWQAAYDQRVADNAQGKVYGDPHFDCLPRGAMGSYHGGNTSFAITQTSGRIQQVFEEQSQIRDIYTDGRKHPSWADVDSDEYEPTPYGHSISHWQGKTLVVDTIGLKKEYTMGNLVPHSDVFHMVERITRLDDDTLDVDIVVDDKKALLKPMSMKIRYRSSPNEDFKQDICENNRNVSDENGYQQTLLKAKRMPGWDLPQE